MKYWVAKDKNGRIHFSNAKLCKPSDWMRDNPYANDEIFWITPDVQFSGTVDGRPVIFIEWTADIPGLTFENSPKQVEFKLI